MLRVSYSRARSLFGIAPVEALASGTPVIAYGEGGALDYIKDKVNGLFFYSQNTKALEDALNQFEQMSFDGATIRQSADRFSNEQFKQQMSNFIEQALEKEAAMIHVKRWLGVEKMNLKFRDWVLLATPLFIFFSYHPVISLGKGEFRTNYEFSLIQIQLIILVLLHIPMIWKKRFTLLKNKAVLKQLCCLRFTTL